MLPINLKVELIHSLGFKVQQTNWSNKMKKSLRKLTQTITAGLLLSSLLLPSAFAADLPPGTVVSCGSPRPLVPVLAADMPAGTVVSGGLTWMQNRSMVPSPGLVNWSTANNTCNALTAGGYSDWRLPTKQELSALYSACKLTIIVVDWLPVSTWSSTDYYGTYHYSVDLGKGSVHNFVNGSKLSVSCVR